MAILTVSSLGAVSNLNNAYCTLAQLRAELGYQTTETADDSKLEQSINAASRQIDGYCSQRFWQDSNVAIQTYYPTTARLLDLMDDDDGDGISTTTGLVVKVDMDNNGTFEQTLTLNTDFILLPQNAAQRIPVYPYTQLQIINPVGGVWFPRPLYGQPTIQVTAKFGWPAVPDDVTKACLIQSAALFKAKDAVFGGVALGDTGAALFVRSALSPMAVALLEPYRKPAVG